jgi:hypothetical protein
LEENQKGNVIIALWRLISSSFFFVQQQHSEKFERTDYIFAPLFLPLGRIIRIKMTNESEGVEPVAIAKTPVISAATINGNGSQEPSPNLQTVPTIPSIKITKVINYLTLLTLRA